MSGKMLGNEQGSGGIGFIGLLTVLFIGLKLTGYVAWSWWWVLSPVWVGVPFCLILATVFIAIVKLLEESCW